jgi:hypothetical protein
MNSSRSAAEEGLLRSVERWTPANAELWGRWRESLRAEQRSEALLPLQAVLSGLVSFRHLENHPPSAPVTDFRPHLHAVRVAYDWALQLVTLLRSHNAAEQRLHAVGEASGEPASSLHALERSLTDARRVSARLLELPVVDAGAFEASCDLFLRDMARNAFFQPPDPLEFSNIAELVRSDGLTPELESWKSPAAKTTTLVAFLTLLRSHRFLGIADQQIGEDEGLYRAHIVVAAVRRELRTLTRFLLVQGVETFADELEARLLSFDAHQITGARTEITRASKELTELRESVEALGMKIHAKVRTTLDRALPELHPEGGYALPAERMRTGIREVRATVKGAAKQLRSLGRPVRDLRTERKSERVRKNNHQDMWAFRFILRAFVAKASVASTDADDWNDVGNLEFVAEFVRHFRMFGPRLTRATDYPRRGPLTRAVSPLSRREAVGPESLKLASHECILFVEHLDGALAEVPQSMLAPFDKSKAASELRGYLAAAKDRTPSDRAAAGAFGLTA